MAYVRRAWIALALSGIAILLVVAIVEGAREPYRPSGVDRTGIAQWVLVQWDSLGLPHAAPEEDEGKR